MSTTIQSITFRIFVAIILAHITFCAHAAVGLMEIPDRQSGAPLTIFYPTDSESAPITRGPFSLDVALDGLPRRGNGRLVVISHGSPASPWVYGDLARTLVAAGFVVALPEHYADNYKDDSESGPQSWKRRPAEVSRAIDVIAADARFSPLLSLDKVGMYGMSAGGHTALTLAGGRWSPAQLGRHCEVHIAEDFAACAGPFVGLNGGAFDGIKVAVARWIVSGKLTDTAWYTHTDPRIAAIVAGVPFAADFDGASLSAPAIPLGLITAKLDKWLNPKFHSGAVLQACPRCERIMEIDNGGHGALISPLPPGRSGSLAELVADPPGFDRAGAVPEINRRITAYFIRHLLGLEAAR